jgi:hypothetical protein
MAIHDCFVVPGFWVLDLIISVECAIFGNNILDSSDDRGGSSNTNWRDASKCFLPCGRHSIRLSSTTRQTPQNQSGLPKGIFLRCELAGFNLVNVAPHPAFSWLDGADEGMLGVMKVLGGMFVFGRITTTYMSADQTHAQVNP